MQGRREGRFRFGSSGAVLRAPVCAGWAPRAPVGPVVALLAGALVWPAQAAPPATPSSSSSSGSGEPRSEADAREAGLDALLAGFAAMPGLYAEFREEKHLALLAAPLVDEGTVHYADGAFARHVLRPTPSSLVVEGGRLVFADGLGRESLDLTANPTAALFVESFTKVLAGDRPALETMYRISWHPTGGDAGIDAGWKLELRPRVAPLDAVVAKIEIFGEGLALRVMRVVEVGGDETVTTFSAVDTRHRYGRRERRRVFSARPEPRPRHADD